MLWRSISVTKEKQHEKSVASTYQRIGAVAAALARHHGSESIAIGISIGIIEA